MLTIGAFEHPAGHQRANDPQRRGVVQPGSRASSRDVEVRARPEGKQHITSPVNGAGTRRTPIWSFHSVKSLCLPEG